MNLKKFRKRLRLLYSSWAKNRLDLWNNADILVVCTLPRSSEMDAQCPKSSAFYKWLLGYEFFDTLMVLSATQIHFVCSPKKASHLKSLKDEADLSVGVDLVVHVNENQRIWSGSKLGEILWLVVMEGLRSAFDDLPAQKMKRNRIDDDDEKSCIGSGVVGWIEEEAVQWSMFVAADKKKKGNSLGLVWKDVTDGFLRVLRAKSEQIEKKGDEKEDGDMNVEHKLPEEVVDELKESTGVDGVLSKMANLGVGRQDAAEAASLEVINGSEMDFAKKREEFFMGDDWVVVEGEDDVEEEYGC